MMVIFFYVWFVLTIAILLVWGKNLLEMYSILMLNLGDGRYALKVLVHFELPPGSYLATGHLR